MDYTLQLRDRLEIWVIIKGKDPITFCHERFTLHPKTQRKLRESTEEIFQAKSNQKRIGVAILTLDKIRLKSKIEERYYLILI